MIIKNARLSFPHIWTADRFSPDQDAKFSAMLIIEKGSEAHDLVTKELRNLRDEKWPKGAPSGLIICLRDGAEKEHLGGFSDDVVFFNATSKARPNIFDRDRTPLAEEDGRPYAGCYVNASVDFWVQDNQFGKRINATLRGLQFAAHGEAFGGGRVAVADDFDDLEESEAPAGKPEAVADDLLG